MKSYHGYSLAELKKKRDEMQAWNDIRIENSKKSVVRQIMKVEKPDFDVDGLEMLTDIIEELECDGARRDYVQQQKGELIWKLRTVV